MDENFSLEELSQCGCHFKIYQDKSKFCFGIDAILLADFAGKIRGKKICDLCTGNGIIPLLLLEKNPDALIDGIEIQHDIANMAMESIKLNGIENKIKIFCGDVKDAASILGKNYCDAVTVNPPYIRPNAQTVESPKSIARQEILCTLEDVIYSASELLKSRGKFFMINRPQRLAETFVLLEKYNMGARKLRMVVPKENERPTMFLVEAEKGAHPELIVEKNLVIYKEQGIYSDEVNGIYGRKL